MSEMDDFGAKRLKDPAHDVDGRVMAIKQTRRSDKTHRIQAGRFKGVVIVYGVI